MRKILFAYILFIFAIPLRSQTANSESNSLIETFEAYIQAYLKRDIPTLKTYFTQNDTLPFITSNGYKTTSMELYLDGLTHWFADTTWSYESKERDYIEYDNVGIVIDNARFYMNNNVEYKMYVTYVFRKEEGMWRMVADICTEIQ